ncbi:MAG: tetratricopeptide repeat protein [Holophagaceae bacterium]|nr:tetratricopeptide repeat protein [Holophagaceae bacterium]
MSLPAPAALIAAIQARQWARAWSLLETAWAQAPGDPALAQLAARAAAEEGQPAKADAYLDLALQGHPGDLGLALCRANLWAMAGRSADAEAAFRRVLALAPDQPAALENLTILLLDQGRAGDALGPAEKLAAALPGSSRAWVLAGSAHADLDHAVLAMAAFERALGLDPASAHAWVELGRVRTRLGLIPEALEACQRAGGAQPGAREPWSNALFALQSLEPDGAALAEAHRAFGRWLEATVPPLPPLPARPKERLRVAFLSADFRDHACACFLEPLLEHLDRDRIEAVALSDTRRPDAVTARLRTHAAAWLDIAHLDDGALAARIRELEVDVLVDCMGHTGDNRLPVFALRPAPLALTWLGYPSTTGLTRIDARLSDALADPPGASEAHHSEAVAHLAAPFLCYRPPEAPPPERRRAGDDAFVFGSFNNLSKLSAPTLALWARVLDEVPGSRLLLKARHLGDPGVQALVRSRFAAAGGDPGRQDLRGPALGLSTHLAMYGEVDVALDPFPYNGATTTCEALWMGVPVLTLAGGRHGSRVGVSLLSAVGLEDCIARDEAGYLALARSLAGNPARLAELRSGLRARMAASPLCDGPRFARTFEATVQGLWREACARAESRA